jgi:TPR repeat protein
MGVYYMEGFGVAQDLNKSELFLQQAQKLGNAQSAF